MRRLTYPRSMPAITGLTHGTCLLLLCLLQPGCTSVRSDKGSEGGGQEPGAPLRTVVPTSSDALRVLPGRSFGQVTARTSRAKLAELFGREALTDVQVGLGEGVTAPGTRVMDGTPRAFTVVWTSESVETAREVRNPGPDWRTPEGVGVGLSLAELERILGPFNLHGFEWDYPGSVSLKGTRLAHHQETLGLMLAPRKEESASTEDYLAVSSSKLFPSASPHMRALDLVVTEMIVRLEPPAAPGP